MSEPLPEPAVVEPTAIEPVAETAVEPGAAVVPAVEAPASVGPDWDNIETLREGAARLAALGYEIRPAQPAAPAEGEEVDYDPYDPNSLLKVLEASPLGQAVQQFQAYLASQQANELDSTITTELEAAKQASGFTLPEGVESPEQIDRVLVALADHFAAELTVPPYATAQQRREIGQQAFQNATGYLSSVIAAAEKSGAEKLKASLPGGIGVGNLLDPAVRGAGTEGAREYRDEMDMARSRTFEPTF